MKVVVIDKYEVESVDSKFDDSFIGRYDDKSLVRYGFIMRIGSSLRGQDHEVKGCKTLKLFRSWFRLAFNWHYKYIPASQRRSLLFGYVEFVETGETWIWQNPNRVYHGGWKLALSAEFAKRHREKLLREKKLAALSGK